MHGVALFLFVVLDKHGRSGILERSCQHGCLWARRGANDAARVRGVCTRAFGSHFLPPPWLIVFVAFPEVAPFGVFGYVII